MTRARSVPFRRAGCALVALALLATGCGSSDKGDGPAAPLLGEDVRGVHLDGAGGVDGEERVDGGDADIREHGDDGE